MILLAGGLKEDAKANNAGTQLPANNIEKKTEKVQKGDLGGAYSGGYCSAAVIHREQPDVTARRIQTAN